jgi:hypothetical protein
MNDLNLNVKMEQDQEEIENYWSGFFEGVKGTEKELSTKQFLKSRNVYFDLSAFHPDDIKFIKESASFERGCFDACGEFQLDRKNVPSVYCKTINIDLNGNEAFIFLDGIYGKIANDFKKELISTKNMLYDPDYLLLFKKLCCNNPAVNYPVEDPIIEYKRLDPDAIAPKKSFITDAGYQLQVIKKIRSKGKTVLYDTGLYIKLPFNYYADIVPEKNLFENTKHSFSNGGNYVLEMGPYDEDEETPKKPLLIELTKLNPSTKDLKVPFLIGSFIPKLRQHFFVKEISE